jgi:hypothetical protein
VFKATRAFIAVLVFSTFAVFALPAFAQAASITVDQACIDPGSVETGGGLVSGSFTGAPTGPNILHDAAVSADRNPGDDWTNFGGTDPSVVGSANIDAEGNGTFSFHLAMYYGSSLPDTLWVKARYWDFGPRNWFPFAETEVPVCGRGANAETDGDGVVDSVDNCDTVVNPGQENNDPDAQGDACDADDDNDDVNDDFDNCQLTANPEQRDDDQDGIGNACDGTFDSNDGKSSGGGWVAVLGGKVNFSSSAKRVDGVMAGNCAVTVGQMKIKCLTVDGYHQSSTNDRAVFVGSANQDGVETRYRIELTDNGEPGSSDHIEITTDAGFGVAGVIGDGNLQVHRGV